MPADELGRLATAHVGLRPIINPVLNALHMDCPSCYAHENDPLGLWRPLMLIPRPGRTILHCQACGRRDER